MIEGRRFIVVEDEFFIAGTICDGIERAGGVVVVVAATVEEGCEAAHRDNFDAAVLDWDLNGKSGEAVAEVLADRGRPFLVSTGYGAVKGRFADRPLLAKPYSSAMLVRALSRLFE